MVFNCKACGATLKESEINFETGIAVCEHCQAVMSFAEDLKISSDKELPISVKAKVGRPENLDIEDSPMSLRLSRGWYHPGLFFLLFFCIAWNAFLIGWYAMGSQMNEPGIMGIIMFIFPIGHVAVGVGLTYTVIAGFLNRTTVEVNASEVSVMHGPVPWKGNKRLTTSEISQIYCKSSKKAANAHTASSLVPTLYAKLHDDRRIKLLSRAGELDILLYLEQRLEERLGIRDAAVSGEHRS
jgi:hypothetical protein